MATPGGAGGGSEAKRCILAAFTAGFIVVALVTISSVVLSPARISFSVANGAGSHDNVSNGGVQRNLTIVANNTSRRAAVLYRSMFVDVSNNTGPQWAQWARATVSMVPILQPPRSVMEIHALVAGDLMEQFAGNKRSHNFSVMVTAVVHFRVGGVVRTRLYDIKVTCKSVDLFANKSSAVGCDAA